MSSKVLEYKNTHTTGQFNQVGVHEKMTEMRSIMWMTIAFGCSFAYPLFSTIGKVFGLHAD